jgi:hypothetical protein
MNPTEPGVAGRSCGPCAACCDFPAVPSLGKPAYQLCQHSGPTGCAIYGERPAPCQAYTCLWLDGEFDEGHRPDQLGLVFDLPTVIEEHSDYEGIRVICAREVRQGARQRPEALRVLLRLARGMVVRLTAPGGRTQLMGPSELVARVGERAEGRRP